MGGSPRGLGGGSCDVFTRQPILGWCRGNPLGSEKKACVRTHAHEKCASTADGPGPPSPRLQLKRAAEEAEKAEKRRKEQEEREALEAKRRRRAEKAARRVARDMPGRSPRRDFPRFAPYVKEKREKSHFGRRAKVLNKIRRITAGMANRQRQFSKYFCFF